MSPLEHNDDWHLYYNMVSFLWKGRELESRMGSIRYFTVLISFIVLTSCCYLGLNLFFFKLTHDEWHLKSCAVGFSGNRCKLIYVLDNVKLLRLGVIFALKVLTTHYLSPSNKQSFMGISVSTKYTYWVELIIIQMVSPNASIIGHLSGILVGLMYIAGPLQSLANFVEGIKHILFG